MPTRPLVYADNPILRRKSHRVERVTPALRALIEDMIETMRAANGIGLAAIQVGVPERVIVVELPAEAEEDEEEGEAEARPKQLYVVINPEIRRASAEMEEGVEGCLSVPGWAGEVSRHLAVTVKGMDVKGKPVRLKAEGLLARVLQHEIDHCDGILFIDRIEDPEKIWQVTAGEEEAAEASQERPEGPRGPVPAE
jgi:peptide deformylase